MEGAGSCARIIDGINMFGRHPVITAIRTQSTSKQNRHARENDAEQGVAFPVNCSLQHPLVILSSQELP